MNGQLSSRQMKTVIHFLTSSSIEEACRKSHVSKGTFYNWLKDENFKQEIQQQRDELVKNALDRLRCSITKATDELIKLLNSPRQDIRRLASKDVIEYTLKSIELEDIEQRLDKLEKMISGKS